MSPTLKVLIGLAAVLAGGWLNHGPLGGGERLIGRIEADARAAVAAAQVPGTDVRLDRDPLSRAATLSGTANQFQREGMGSMPGLNDRVRAVEGVAAVGWAGEAAPRRLPLLLEELAWLAAAYVLGLTLGAFLFTRRRRQSYLD